MARDFESAQEQLAKAVYAQTAGSTNLVRPASLRENIGEDLARAKANVARLEELAKLIDANPATSRILELMGQR